MENIPSSLLLASAEPAGNLQPHRARVVCCETSFSGLLVSSAELLTEVLAALAALGVTGIASAGVAYWLFRTFAKGWLDAHFQKDLEAMKAANTREVERLKADLGRYADRATKFHAREYEVLPEAWGLMNKAYGACNSAVSAFQQQADLNRMTAPQLEAWFEGSGLEEFQKDEIRGASDKNEKYSTFRSWKQIGDAERATNQFQNYVILQGVFIDEDLSAKMMGAAMTMRKALISRSMVERMQGYPSRADQPDFWLKAMEELEPVEKTVLEVKATVRERLSDIKPPMS